MNASFTYDGKREYNELPYRLEAGTPNIAGIIGFGEAVSYLEKIGMDKIHAYEKELKIYALKRLKEIKEIVIYNEHTEGSIITFNYAGVFAQDLAIYLDKYKICVRAGNHCAKILKDELGIKNTCRLSFYFYNTKDEIDKLIAVLKNPNLKKEII
jgi:cysteine desulfurase/selenocysteine lyase